MLSGEAGGGHDLTKTNQTMGRSVRDSAALLDYTEDKSGKRYEPIGFIEGPSKRRLKIGLIRDSTGLLEVSAEVRKAQEDTAKLLEELGHTIVESSYPVKATDFVSSWPIFFRGRLLPLKKHIESTTGQGIVESGLMTKFNATFAVYLEGLDASKTEAAHAFFDAMPQVFEEALADLDLFLLPVAPTSGPKLTAFDPDESFTEASLNTLLGQLQFTGPVNFAGNPAMTVPLHFGGTDRIPNWFTLYRENRQRPRALRAGIRTRGGTPVERPLGTLFGQTHPNLIRMKLLIAALLSSWILPAPLHLAANPVGGQDEFLGGPDSVGSQLEGDDAESEGAPTEAWAAYKERLRDQHGFDFGFDYATLYQTADSSISGVDDAASGVVRLFGKWTLLGHDTPDTGKLVWKVENRHPIGGGDSSLATRFRDWVCGSYRNKL